MNKILKSIDIEYNLINISYYESMSGITEFNIRDTALSMK
jgi:hypothetical protein